ncbi:CshA/CshB family fibrillar adhesin-related protein [Erythrobacter sp.]|uniref:CshA/CshB family fibrillar adhesin-related protein n=1 Tax=Erythrobacter sp. TaxID=1042 RepID=UPI00260067B0|nr:CshA/CshB family fibrillar adhesin-related protein [Erythrobacter sp.]
MRALRQIHHANRLFTIIPYVKGMMAGWTMLRRLMALVVVVCGLLWSPAARAQDCGQATAQGTAPASWQTYCWLDFADYNDATARTAAGQNLSFTLPDGSVLTFNARVSGNSTVYNAVTAPSWTGAAIGNVAFIGIPGRPVLYTTSAGSRTINLSNITVTPPVGASATVYSFVVADAESSNDNEALRYSTNGGAWQLLDAVQPISGSTFPSITGVGSNTVNITGRPGTVGAHILGSNSPTSVTIETQAGGLQGVMFAIRFASIRLQTTIQGPRTNSADQFSYQIVNTTTGSTIFGGTTSGSGSGPFSTAPLSMAAGVPITLRENMASGSVSTLSQYVTTLTCVNTAGATRASLPNGLATTSVNIGQLEFGEFLVCTFTNGAQPRLRLRKALDGFRRFNGDQFTVRIMSGETVIAAATTTGSGSTVNAGDTGFVQLDSGLSYTLSEIAAGTGNLGNYEAELACSNATSGSATTLPNTVGGSITPQLGDTITCIITNSRITTAVLEVDKTSVVISDPVNGTTNPKAIPGAIVEYSITIRNVGRRSVDSSSIVIIDDMPADMAFSTGTPVTFQDGSPESGLNAFNAATMVRFSSASGTAGPFTYTPNGAFDPNVRTIRIAPAGTMDRSGGASDQPSFTIRFRARVQ